MPINFFKKGLRALGIAESFDREQGREAVLAGVVMRSDLIIDGFGFSSTTLGGMDATEGVMELYKKLDRKDINLLLLNGCIISLFNIVRLGAVHRALSLPVLCVTYEESPGIEKYLAELDHAEERLEAYRKLGEREEVELKTGKRVYVRYEGMRGYEARHLLNRFTHQGSVPEPLRVARLLARGLMRQEG